VLIVAAIALSFAARWQLAVVIAAYLALTVLYSLWLKHEAVLDLACVAAGFVLARDRRAVSRWACRSPRGS
jgi:decaprenyl-phosphate phosphoribosyltransferase